MSHTYANLLAHVIFSTKGRTPLIKGEFRSDLFAYMGGIIREAGGKAVIINGAADHVHLLVGLPPSRSLSDLVRILKANSSRWAREQTNAQAVAAYIARQEQHHRKTSFAEEFVAFLKKHGVEYDERYLWG